MKKEIKENGAVKSTKPCRMKFFKRVMSVISVVALTAAMFVGAAFTFTGCSKEPAPDNPPSIVQPVPDDPEEGETEQPGGDENEGEQGGTEQPGETDPEEGETEQPGETDPEQGEEGNEGETPDPGVTDPEQGETENPGEDVTEPEVPDTIEELVSEENKIYQATFIDTLNSYATEDLVKTIAGNNYDMSRVDKDSMVWRVETAEDNATVTKVQLSFDYNTSTSTTYCVASVTPYKSITVSQLIAPETNASDIATAFKAQTDFEYGAVYARDYAFGYDPSIQEERADLLDAVNKKLAEDGKISAVDENTQSFIVDDGSNTNATLNGTARTIRVMNLTENGYEEFTIRVKENQSNNNDTTLIENLNNGEYYEVETAARSGTFTGTVLENVDLPQQETEVANYSLVYTNEKGETEEYELDL